MHSNTAVSQTLNRCWNRMGQGVGQRKTLSMRYKSIRQSYRSSQLFFKRPVLIRTYDGCLTADQQNTRNMNIPVALSRLPPCRQSSGGRLCLQQSYLHTGTCQVRSRSKACPAPPDDHHLIPFYWIGGAIDGKAMWQNRRRR